MSLPGRLSAVGSPGAGGSFVSKLVRGAEVGTYRLVTDLGVRDAGTSMWGFADRDGSVYFVKQHTSPKWPVEGVPGSAKSKARRREVCKRFERRKRRLQKELGAVGSDGGVVVITDFFRDGPYYYTITPKIDVSAMRVEDVAALELDARYVVLASAAKAINALHSRNIVHSDIKPANLLVKETRGSHAARLIDFDAAYQADDPPTADELPGDPAYFAPEMLIYVKTGGTVGKEELGTQSDIFAAGLVFYEYLVGERIPYDREAYQSPAHAVAEGAELSVPDIARVPNSVSRVLAQMLRRRPADRPSMIAVHRVIRDARVGMGRSSSGEAPTAPVAELRTPRRSTARVIDLRAESDESESRPPTSGSGGSKLKPPRKRSSGKSEVDLAGGSKLKPPRNRR